MHEDELRRQIAALVTAGADLAAPPAAPPSAAVAGCAGRGSRPGPCSWSPPSPSAWSSPRAGSATRATPAPPVTQPPGPSSPFVEDVRGDYPHLNGLQVVELGGGRLNGFGSASRRRARDHPDGRPGQGLPGAPAGGAEPGWHQPRLRRPEREAVREAGHLRRGHGPAAAGLGHGPGGDRPGPDRAAGAPAGRGRRDPRRARLRAALLPRQVGRGPGQAGDSGGAGRAGPGAPAPGSGCVVCGRLASSVRRRGRWR